MGKVLGVQQFLSAKKRRMEFTGAWYDLLGRPAPYGTWIIWGLSISLQKVLRMIIWDRLL